MAPSPMHMPTSLVAVIGVPACTAAPPSAILVNKTLPLWLSNIPAGGSHNCSNSEPYL